MAIDSNAHKVHLNKVTHSQRISQLVYQYGVGAMVDFPDQTLMTAAPELWATQTVKVHDERLEKALHVDYFGVPASSQDEGFSDGMSYARFPEWYFCPKCRSFKPIDEWINDYKHMGARKKIEDDPYMVKHMKCPTCNAALVVSRIVSVCNRGHIDDFPWVEWTHARARRQQVCSAPKLQLRTATGANEGLESIEVLCLSCGAHTTLSGAFSPNAFEALSEKSNGQYNFSCTGRHPWKHQKERCGCYPRAMQRGSSSVYFPITVTSLVIPPYSSILTTNIENSHYFNEGKSKINDYMQLSIEKSIKQMLIENAIQESAQKIALEIGTTNGNVFQVLKRRWLEGEVTPEDDDMSDTAYKFEEYDALNGALQLHDSNYDGDFVREGTDIAAYHLPLIKSISLIHKIREIIALIGFSRTHPVEAGYHTKHPEGFVSVKEPNTCWYPAYQIRGEGIFIEFDEETINSWRNENALLNDRTELLKDNYKNSFIGSQRPRKITSKYLLLHTISHLLIKQLSFECGYSIASLQERIYCSEPDDGKTMSGIFIYTAGGDSEGTMGGLVRQGRADIFPKIFKKAMESARLCSNDPVCSLSKGQGRDSLNLATCYSCTLIPETSCEDYNIFLDRGTVAGTMAHPNLGFMTSSMNNNWRESFAYHPTKQPTAGKQVPAARDVLIPIDDTGSNTDGTDWEDIWEDIEAFASNEKDSETIGILKDAASRFYGKEYPWQLCEFRIVGIPGTYKAHLLWKKSGIVLFVGSSSAANQAVLSTNWKCFNTSDGFDIEELFNALKEE